MTAVIPGPAARGAVQTLEVFGPMQSSVAVFASPMHPFDPIPTSFGDVWIDPHFVLHVGTGPVDPQRKLTLTTTIPSWLPIGDVLVYQAVSLSSAGRFELSPPGIAVVH